MKTLKIKNLDGLYSVLKSEAGQLQDRSWGSPKFEVAFQAEKGGLLGWFFENIGTLKRGCEKLLVAKASVTEPGFGYTKQSERLFISSEPSSLGLIVRITREVIQRWGSDNYDGTYGSKMLDPVEQVFMLDVEPVEELV